MCGRLSPAHGAEHKPWTDSVTIFVEPILMYSDSSKWQAPFYDVWRKSSVQDMNPLLKYELKKYDHEIINWDG